MSARVTLYVRPGCHLCDDARTVVAEACVAAGEAFDEVDIDASGDAALRERLTDLVPVVEVDGTQVGYWRIKPGNVSTALAAGGGQ